MAITSQILVSDKKSVFFGTLRFSATHLKYKKPYWGPLAGPPAVNAVRRNLRGRWGPAGPKLLPLRLCRTTLTTRILFGLSVTQCGH